MYADLGLYDSAGSFGVATTRYGLMIADVTDTGLGSYRTTTEGLPSKVCSQHPGCTGLGSQEGGCCSP